MVGFVHKLFRYSIDWLLRNEIESYSNIHGYILLILVVCFEIYNLKYCTLNTVVWMTNSYAVSFI